MPLCPQGSVALIVQDMRSAGLPEHVVEFVEASLYARGAAKAFLMRTELVNYKKVCRRSTWAPVRA
jgi:hypothetical protein